MCQIAPSWWPWWAPLENDQATTWSCFCFISDAQRHCWSTWLRIVNYSLINVLSTRSNEFTTLLHGEFQPGLKFRSAHRAELFFAIACSISARSSWNFVPPTGLEFCGDCHLNLVPRAHLLLIQIADALCACHPGPKFYSCNLGFFIRVICSESRAGVSARVAGLKNDSCNFVSRLGFVRMDT